MIHNQTLFSLRSNHQRHGFEIIQKPFFQLIRFYTLFVIYFSSSLNSNLSAQNDNIPLNSFDKETKRHGLWKTYIDSNLNTVNIEHAVWYYYALYYHGKKLLVLDERFLKEKHLQFMTSIERPNLSQDSITAIDGTFIVLRKNGGFDKLRFLKGIPQSRFINYHKYGYNWERYDFTEKRGNNPYSYSFESPSSKKRIKGFFYGEKGKLKSTKTKYEFISPRYDADSSQLLFNGYYMGAFDYRIIYDTASYNSIIYSNNNACNLILDTSSFYYEDYHCVMEGRQDRIGNDSINFTVESIDKKSRFKELPTNVVFRGTYQVKFVKKKVLLIKEDRSSYVVYRLSRDFYNPFISKEEFPKPGLRIISK